MRGKSAISSKRKKEKKEREKKEEENEEFGEAMGGLKPGLFVAQL